MPCPPLFAPLVAVGLISAALAPQPAGIDPPASAPAASAPTPEPPATGTTPTLAVPAPHPIITEILYAVPTAAAGDANKDGKRDAAGDEFIELFNPHDKPIQLFGYTLTDSQEPGKGQFKFTFPALELPPGGVVVVFNGLNSVWSGPVGDAKVPPSAPNENFNSAWVFTMKNTSSKVALGNAGDHILLSAPDKAPIHRVRWSETSDPSTPAPTLTTPVAPAANPPATPGSPPTPATPKRKPGDPLLDEFVTAVQRSSIQRDSVFTTGRFGPHTESDKMAFSPGLYRTPVAPK